MWGQALLISLITVSSLCSSNKKVPGKISSGAWLTPVDNVILYTDVEHIFFSTPQIPKVMDHKPMVCESQEYCGTFEKNDKIIQAAYNLSALITKMFTIRGLDMDEEKPEDWPASFYGPINSNDHQPKNISIREIVGHTEMEWMRNLQLLPRAGERKRRALLPIVSKALVVVPPIMDLFKNLFNSKDAVVHGISSTKKFLTRNHQSQFDIAPFVSEIVSSLSHQRKSISKVMAAMTKTPGVPVGRTSGFTVPLDLEFNSLTTRIHLLNKMISDIAYLLHHSQIMTIHSSAMSSCRANEIPLSFVTPKMLYKRLTDLQDELPKTMKLAISPSNLFTYYKLDNADCTFSDGTGLVSVEIPIKPRDTKLKLFKFQGLSFRDKGQTCSFALPSQYVAVDELNSDFTVISDLDEDNCEPSGTGKCLVPPLNSVSIAEYPCIQAIISRSTHDELRSACPMTCIPTEEIQITQPSSGVVIITNLPKSGAKVTCDTGEKEIENEVPTGALEITLGCHCVLMIGSKVISRSNQKICTKPELFIASVLHLIPAQWIKKNGPTIDTRVENIFEILDSPWDGEEEEASVSDWVENQTDKISWLTFGFQLLQGLITGYVYYKINGLAAVTAVVMERVQRVRGADKEKVVCDLPFSTELILYATLVFVLLNFIFIGVRKCVTQVKKCWVKEVHRAAALRDIEGGK